MAQIIDYALAGEINTQLTRNPHEYKDRIRRQSKPLSSAGLGEELGLISETTWLLLIKRSDQLLTNDPAPIGSRSQRSSLLQDHG